MGMKCLETLFYCKPKRESISLSKGDIEQLSHTHSANFSEQNYLKVLNSLEDFSHYSSSIMKNILEKPFPFSQTVFIYFLTGTTESSGHPLSTTGSFIKGILLADQKERVLSLMIPYIVSIQ